MKERFNRLDWEYLFMECNTAAGDIKSLHCEMNRNGSVENVPLQDIPKKIKKSLNVAQYVIWQHNFMSDGFRKCSGALLLTWNIFHPSTDK